MRLLCTKLIMIYMMYKENKRFIFECAVNIITLHCFRMSSSKEKTG